MCTWGYESLASPLSFGDAGAPQTARLCQPPLQADAPTLSVWSDGAPESSMGPIGQGVACARLSGRPACQVCLWLGISADGISAVFPAGGLALGA